jgi:ABC-type antimicrobial peptide transport system permease subunit
MRNGLDASTGAGATVGAAVGVQAPATTVGRRSAAPRTFWRDTLGSLRRQKGALIGLTLIGLVLVAALIGAVAVPETANRSSLGQRLNPPSAAHVLGTDGSGRDILLRVLLGAPLSLAVGVVSIAIGSVLGACQGLVAGFRGGLLSAAIMRFTDVMLAFPSLLFALAVMATLGGGLWNVMLAIGISSMPRFTRLMYSEVLSIREREYVSAARATVGPGAQHPVDLDGHSRRGDAQLPGPRTAPADGHLGLDDLGWHVSPRIRAVGSPVPRSGDHADGPGIQPVRRRPARRARRAPA